MSRYIGLSVELPAELDLHTYLVGFYYGAQPWTWAALKWQVQEARAEEKFGEVIEIRVWPGDEQPSPDREPLQDITFESVEAEVRRLQRPSQGDAR